MPRVAVELGEAVFAFRSKQDWVNKGARIWRTYDVTDGRGIAIDTFGRVLKCGRDFARAEQDGAYPVTVYRIELTEAEQLTATTAAAERGAQPKPPCGCR